MEMEALLLAFQLGGFIRCRFCPCCTVNIKSVELLCARVRYKMSPFRRQTHTHTHTLPYTQTHTEATLKSFVHRLPTLFAIPIYRYVMNRFASSLRIQTLLLTHLYRLMIDGDSFIFHSRLPLFIPLLY